MNGNKIRGLMGLCVRARQAVFGEDGCLKTVRGGGCGVLLLDSGASAATKDKYRGACANAGVPLAELPAGLLHEATGKPGMAMAVQRGGLADQLIGLVGLVGTEPADNEQQKSNKAEPKGKAGNKCGGATVE